MSARVSTTISYDNGDKYDGEVNEHGVPDGSGTYSYVRNGNQSKSASYKGSWRNGKQHGKGVYRYANGDIYNGPWLEGKRHGENGKYTYKKEEAEYEGEWENDMKHGRGQMKFANGDSYSGMWKNNTMVDKKGTYIYHDGAKYVGSWESGKKRKGKLIYENGDIYEGEFKDGLQFGPGTYKFSNGSVRLFD